MSLTFDLLTSKSNEIIYWSYPTNVWSFERFGQKDLELLIGNQLYEVLKDLVTRILSYWLETIFKEKVTVTLTFDLLTSKSLGVIYWSYPTTVWSFNYLVKGLSSYWSETTWSTEEQTDRPTDRQTDRPTDIWKAIYPLFLKGAHKNCGLIWKGHAC